MSYKYVKRSLASLLNIEIQVEMSYLFFRPPELLKLKKYDNTQCWWGYSNTGILWAKRPTSLTNRHYLPKCFLFVSFELSISLP